MFIKNLDISNFKSFKDLAIDLNNFNVLIGANASGKSNFIQVFRFIKDLAKYGLGNAISYQGGIEYLKNIKTPFDEPISIKITFYPLDKEVNIFSEYESVLAKLNEVAYNIVIYPENLGTLFDYQSIRESFIIKFESFKVIAEDDRDKEKRKVLLKINKDSMIVLNKLHSKRVDYNDDELPKEIKSKIGKYINFSYLLLFNSLWDGYVKPIDDYIGIYNINPFVFKDKTSLLTSENKLKEDGSNLPVILKNILKNSKKRKTFFYLLNFILDFIEDIKIEGFGYKDHVLLKLKESYYKDYLPSFLISEGTLSIISLIVALYFDRNKLVIIEEIERNIHPSLVSYIINMIKGDIKDKQVIITTHSPEVLKYSGLDNILLVSRNKEGFSNIYKPADKETVKIFLQNEIGIDELYIQNLI
jgi:predicted ATPase